MNWKVRMRHKWFIAASVALLARIAVGEGILDETTVGRWVDYVERGLELLVFVGIIVDPTTKDLPDSERAKEYERPM